jgi:Small Multidrug Resistance protein
MAWIYLFVAGVFETAWAIGLKYSAGFYQTRPEYLDYRCHDDQHQSFGRGLANFARRHRLCSLDRYRHRRRGHPWNISFQ